MPLGSLVKLVGEVVKCGHIRINLHFSKPSEEKATVLLYITFPSKIKVDIARNILCSLYKGGTSQESINLDGYEIISDATFETQVLLQTVK